MDNEQAYKDISLILAEKQRVIDQLTEEKNSLLKIISHDIRAPFNQMFALLQLMELEVENVTLEQKNYLDKMYHSVIGGMEMVKNLHDSRAIDQDKISVRIEPVNISMLLKQAIRNFSIQARLKATEIDLDDRLDNLSVHTDGILVKKIIENILSNAIKYSENGSSVRITARAEDGGPVISITDQGPGLKEEEISHITEKFRKLGPKPTQGEGTTGLGMYLAEKFAELINGSLLVKNADKKGLEVILRLPDKIDHSE